MSSFQTTETRRYPLRGGGEMHMEQDYLNMVCHRTGAVWQKIRLETRWHGVPEQNEPEFEAWLAGGMDWHNVPEFMR